MSYAGFWHKWVKLLVSSHCPIYARAEHVFCLFWHTLVWCCVLRCSVAQPRLVLRRCLSCGISRCCPPRLPVPVHPQQSNHQYGASAPRQRFPRVRKVARSEGGEARTGVPWGVSGGNIPALQFWQDKSTAVKGFVNCIVLYCACANKW